MRLQYSCEPEWVEVKLFETRSLGEEGQKCFLNWMWGELFPGVLVGG